MPEPMSACRESVPVWPQRFLLVAALSAGILVALSVASTAAETKKRALPYPALMEVASQDYVPASRGAGRQILRLKLNVGRHVPAGARIKCQLEDAGNTIAQGVFELKSENRAGVTFEWKLDKPVDPGTYDLMISLPSDPAQKGEPVKQTSEVLRVIGLDKRNFPPNYLGWVDMFPGAVKVGTPEELKAFDEKICALYDSFVAELIKNKKEYDDTLDAVEAGKKFTSRGEVQRKDLVEFVHKWRRQQGEMQRKINSLILDEPVIFRRTVEAFTALTNLGQMVSRDSLRRLEALEKAKGLETIEIKADPKEKKDEALAHFRCDRWLGRTDKEALNEEAERLYSVACPEPEPEPEEAAKKSGDAGEKSGEAAKKSGDAGEKSGEAGKKSGEAAKKSSAAGRSQDGLLK
ncbi:MAG: hypothetical protein JXA90_07175 [Planctomycetes bacterium]|nr:hypothetical protein [Planctomycetota bacterium]